MNNLYDEIMGEIEGFTGDVDGLYITIDGFDYSASFENDGGYQIISSQDAEQLLALDNEDDYDLLCEKVTEIASEWNDILIADYQATMAANRTNDKNYHGMQTTSNWI